jgi:hypothetical protein
MAITFSVEEFMDYFRRISLKCIIIYQTKIIS